MQTHDQPLDGQLALGSDGSRTIDRDDLIVRGKAGRNGRGAGMYGRHVHALAGLAWFETEAHPYPARFVDPHLGKSGLGLEAGLGLGRSADLPCVCVAPS